MSFEKYDKEVIVLDRTRNYEQNSPDHKPRGIWFSIPGEDDWPHWVESESFRVNNLTHRHIVGISADARLLVLTNHEQLDLFHEKYKMPLIREYELIDWVKVSETYDGIVIAPYIWSQRMDTSWIPDSPKATASDWYYSWDVASGCIWNLEKVISVALPFNADTELNMVQLWVCYNAEVRAENAINLMKFGTADPTGGAGRLPLTFDQFKSETFVKWITP
jgi:hypothetical protein